MRARVYAHEDALSSVSACLTFYYHPLTPMLVWLTLQLSVERNPPAGKRDAQQYGQP